MGKRLTAIDLFCGAGGVSLGLEAAGYEVLLANDMNSAAAETHRRQFPKTAFVEKDVRTLTGNQITKHTGLRRGELDLLIGGPPCQGYSIIGARLIQDPRNDLFKEFLRIGKELGAKCLAIENVPGLATIANGAILQSIRQGFAEIGYSVGFAELLAAQYGVPQMRWRMVFVGFRNDMEIPSGMGFPKPTHGSSVIGGLVPNCRISAEESKGFLTTFEAIGDLPAVGAGQEISRYVGPPKCAYQRIMREGLKDEVFNHYAPSLSQVNLDRISLLKAGQDWRDLPHELLPDGMKRAKRKDHTRRYSRMTWDGIPRSIITRFRDPKSGEYSHPTQNRTISIREAARIQSFPDRFEFMGTHSEQYDLVGNAVPPLLAQAIGVEIQKCLRGTATHRLENAFSRRPGLNQLRLPFHAI